MDDWRFWICKVRNIWKVEKASVLTIVPQMEVLSCKL